MKRRMITEEMIRDFERFLQEDEKSELTIEKYLHDVKVFKNYAEGCAVDKSMAMSFKSELGKKYAVTSANSMLAAVNSFFKFVGWHDCCVKRFKIQQRIFCPEERELTKAEYFRLINAARQAGNRRMEMILQTIGATGIRVSELSSITVEAVMDGEASVACKGRTRSVFLVNKLRKKLIQYIKSMGVESGPVFVTRTGRPLNRSNIWREMKKLCTDANVAHTKVFPHNLRHLFARMFYTMEKDIAKLADILGHASINTTRIYMVTTGREHRKRMETMNMLL